MAEKQKKVQEYKIKAVEALQDRFEESEDFIFTNFRGLTVEQISDLRKQLRQESSEYKVIKNNYAKIAFSNMKVEGVDDFLVGPTAIAMAKGESGPTAKVLVKFAEETPVEIKGGFINGRIFDPTEVEDFSKLPTRLELIAKLMGTMNAPVQHLAFALNGVTQNLVRALQAVADQKNEG